MMNKRKMILLAAGVITALASVALFIFNLQSGPVSTPYKVVYGVLISIALIMFIVDLIIIKKRSGGGRR